jgi:hypothetical protein
MTQGTSHAIVQFQMSLTYQFTNVPGSIKVPNMYVLQAHYMQCAVLRKHPEYRSRG